VEVEIPPDLPSGTHTLRVLMREVGSNTAIVTVLLNQLLTAVGGAGALSGLPGGLAGLFTGGSVSPQQAATISPDQVQQIAAHAEKHDPSVVGRVSSFYSQHPDVIKAVGGLALSIAVQHMVRRH